MANNITLSASYDICASHVLKRAEWDEATNLRHFGHCARLHGHQYKITLTLAGRISEQTGMLINGYEVDHIVQEKIIQVMDHRHLNEDIPFFKEHLPTAEWIAVWVFRQLQPAFPVHCNLTKVCIFETPTLFAEFCGD